MLLKRHTPKALVRLLDLSDGSRFSADDYIVDGGGEVVFSLERPEDLEIMEKLETALEEAYEQARSDLLKPFF